MDFASKPPINDLSEFKTFLSKLFDCDHENMYDDINNSDNLALFYRTFLKYPETFTDFLEYISDPSLKFKENVYEDINILTLMSFAVFHLSNIYTMIDEEAVAQAANFFHKPFSVWISKVIVNNKLELHQTTSHFYNTFQYLMLMSYISVKLKMEERPLYVFLKKTKDTAISLKLDVYNDILFPLINEDFEEDIYNQSICDIVLIDYTYFLRSNDSNENFLKDNVFNNEQYTLTDFFGGNHEIRDKMTEHITKFNNLQISANQFNIMTFLFVGQIFGIYPYSLTTSDSIIEYDDIWYHTIKVLCKRLTSSTHMQLDLQVFLHKINNLVDFSHLSYDDVTILFAIIDNRYFEDNSKYIRNMLKALLTKKYDKFDILGKIPHKNGEYSFLMKIDLSTDRDVLIKLLTNIFTSNTHTDFNWHVDFKDELQSIDSIQDISVFSKESKSPPKNDLGMYFKNVIKGLLKLREKYNDTVTYRYLENLYGFEDELRGIDIYLTEYKISMVSNTPNSRYQFRSIDGTVSTPKMKEHIGDLFKHKNNNVSFANKKLLKRLQKIYVRTVEGSSADEYNKPNRISKIRKYLKIAYSEPDGLYDDIIIRDVENGKEFDMLFDTWKRKKNSIDAALLYVKFFIKYKTGLGIDEGGITKHFFNNIVKQLQTKYFIPAYLGSDRYILNSKNIPSNDIAEFIGELLAFFIINEIYLLFGLSTYYMANLMFYGNLSNEDKFLYFLLDIDKANLYNDYLKHCEHKYTGNDFESEEYYNAMKCDPAYIVTNVFPDIYAHKQEHFTAFCKGFFIMKKTFHSKFVNIRSKIRMYDLDKLLSMPRLSRKVIKAKIFDTIHLTYMDIENPRIIDENDDTAETYRFFKYIMIDMRKSEYARIYADFDTSIIQDDPERQTCYEDLKSFNVFKQNVLYFWTGSYGIHSELYRVVIDPSVNLFPVSHTCFNQFDFPVSGKIISVEHFVNTFIGIFVRHEHSIFDIS